MEANYTNDKMKLGVLRARDEDIGKNGLVEYTISSNVAAGMRVPPKMLLIITMCVTCCVDFPFSIDVHTGELFAQSFIDREQRETYTFEVTVSSCSFCFLILYSHSILGFGLWRTSKQFNH